MNDRISKLLDEMPLIPKETRLHSVQRCAARNSCASIALASLTGINPWDWIKDIRRYAQNELGRKPRTAILYQCEAIP